MQPIATVFEQCDPISQRISLPDKKQAISMSTELKVERRNQIPTGEGIWEMESILCGVLESRLFDQAMESITHIFILLFLRRHTKLREPKGDTIRNWYP